MMQHSASEIVFLSLTLLMVSTVFFRLYDYHSMRTEKRGLSIYQVIYEKMPQCRLRNMIKEGTISAVGIMISVASVLHLYHGGHGPVLEGALAVSILLLIIADRHFDSIREQYIQSRLRQ